MRSRSELTPALRERICELHSAVQWGYKRIHKRYPWISLSTIRYTIKKEQETRAGVSKPRSGRPNKLNEADKVRLLDAIQQNPRTTREDLLTEVSHRVKIDSIRRLLNAENLRKWRCSWRPYLTEEHAQKRRQWAFKYQHFTPEDWARVFGLMNVRLKEALEYAVNRLLPVRKTSLDSDKSKVFHKEGSKLSRCFGLLFRGLRVEPG